MKTKIKLAFSTLVILMVLTGCPYESNFTLSDPKDSSIDSELLGKWITKTYKTGNCDTLVIMRFNDHEYYIESHEINNSKPEINRGRMFITPVNGKKILNFNVLNEQGKFYFASYVCSGNRMTMSFVSDQYLKKEFNSGRELLDSFKSNFGKQGFFETPDTLKRISEL
jgi:hypothetical protein